MSIDRGCTVPMDRLRKLNSGDLRPGADFVLYWMTASRRASWNHALDRALRKDLGKYQTEIEGLELVDYKVRILNGGTEAITRVLIESMDETGERWWTVGVSDNIIDASFQALIDSLNYKLITSGAAA